MGLTSAIGPALGVFVVMLGLMSAIGGPIAWQRLSIIGAAPTELTAATMAAQAQGLELGGQGYGLINFANASWVMALNGSAWLLTTGLFTDKLAIATKKISGGDTRKLAIIGGAAMCGAFGYLFGDYIIGLHDGNISPDMEPGRFAISTGAMMACLDRFTLKVIGKGSHGAYPHQSHDTLVIASLIVVGIQEIIAREIDPVEPGVITLGKFHAGSTYNVIPGEAEIEGTLRAVTQETRDYLAKRIGEVAEGIAKTYKATVEYDYLGGAPPVINDHEVATRVHDSIAKVLGEDRVDYMERPVMGGEDFAYYLEQVPGCFIFMSNPLPIDGTVYPHHNPKFALNEANFKDALAAFLQITFDLLEA